MKLGSNGGERKAGGGLAPQHRRPHLDPDSTVIRRAVADCLPDEPGRFIVAVSGGPDSVALAAACAHLDATTEHSFTAVIVDHGLQPGSAHIAVRTAGMVMGLGLPAIVRTVKVERTASGLEADARSARYGALEEARIAVGAQAVLTGHTRDDQAETVLLGLLRGSGSRALAAMRPRTGTVWRPLLGIERRQTVASAYAQRIPVWHDPMNRDPDYTRVNVRQRVLPALTDHLGGGFVRPGELLLVRVPVLFCYVPLLSLPLLFDVRFLTSIPPPIQCRCPPFRNAFLRVYD